MRKGLAPTPAIPVVATPMAAVTPITLMIVIIAVIPAALIIPVTPTVTVVAAAMVPTNTAKFENFRDPHIVRFLSSIFLGLEPTRRVEGT